jgi:hypothetical protein
MNHKILIIFIATVIVSSCKREFDAQPTFANPSIAGTWAKQQPFYQPNSQRFDSATNTWRTFGAFTFTSDAEPDKIGFANPYVAGKGTNALDFNRLYTAQNLTSDSGYYNVTIPKCFQLIPKSKDSLQTGTVVVLEQLVKVFRRDKSSFNIKISPSSQPGTYNTISGLLEIEVAFDESSIGGPSLTRRRYRFTP